MEVRHDNVIEEVRYHTVEKKSTKTTIPFVKNNNFDYAQLVNWAGEYKEEAAWLVFVLMVIFVVTAVSNGGEPDGRPGRLGCGKLGDHRGSTRYTCLYVVALRVRLFPEYHVHPRSGGVGGVMRLPLSGPRSDSYGTTAYPAQVFMGDTGSLTLGGIIAVFAIIIRKELLIPILVRYLPGGEYIGHYASGYFKYTKKKYGEGRRIFKMAPLHHHFQKPGNAGIQALIQKPFNVVPESKIVVRFWLIGIILVLFWR